MTNEISSDMVEHGQQRLARFTQKQVNPEDAQRAALIGSLAAGLTVQTLTREGWEGAVYGAGAAVTGVLTVVALLAVPVSLPILVAAGVAGTILGSLPKPSRIKQSLQRTTPR